MLLYVDERGEPDVSLETPFVFIIGSDVSRPPTQGPYPGLLTWFANDPHAVTMVLTGDDEVVPWTFALNVLREAMFSLLPVGTPISDIHLWCNDTHFFFGMVDVDDPEDKHQIQMIGRTDKDAVQTFLQTVATRTPLRTTTLDIELADILANGER